ncbi:MAG: hypothetical protein ACLFU0_12190, partial [Alphaproteobacteria bacterium]
LVRAADGTLAVEPALAESRQVSADGTPFDAEGEPSRVGLDEAVAALDGSMKTQVPALLRDLQRRLGLARVVIDHALAVVEAMAETVLVMRTGRVVERGGHADISASRSIPAGASGWPPCRCRGRRRT